MTTIILAYPWNGYAAGSTLTVGTDVTLAVAERLIGDGAARWGVGGPPVPAEAFVPWPPVGTTPGDVPTVQSDGSIAYAAPTGGGGGSTLVEQALQTSDPGPSTMGGHWPFNLSGGSKQLTLPAGSLAFDGQQIGAEVQAGWGRGKVLHVIARGSDSFETATTTQDCYLRGAHEKVIWQYRWATRTFFIVAAYKDRTDFLASLNNQDNWVTATQYYSGDVVTALGGRYIYTVDTVSGATITADATAGKAVYVGVDISALVTLPAAAAGNLHNNGADVLSWL